MHDNQEQLDLDYFRTANTQPNHKYSINSSLTNLFIENCKLYDDRRNVERKLETHFQVSNLSSDIPAGVIGTQFIRKQMQ